MYGTKNNKADFWGQRKSMSVLMCRISWLFCDAFVKWKEFTDFAMTFRDDPFAPFLGIVTHPRLHVEVKISTTSQETVTEICCSTCCHKSLKGRPVHLPSFSDGGGVFCGLLTPLGTLYNFWQVCSMCMCMHASFFLIFLISLAPGMRWIPPTLSCPPL